MRKGGRSRSFLVSLWCAAILAAPSAAPAADEVFGPQVCLRGGGAPSVYEHAFSVADPSRGYVLKVANGGLEDGLYEKVSSSVVTLNGVEVLGPENFNQKVSSLEVLVPKLAAQNTLRVEVRGKPGGALVIAVVPLVVIESPAERQAFAAVSVPVAGRLHAAVSSVNVNGIPGRVSGARFVVDDVPLVEGTNVVTASAVAGSEVAGRDSTIVVRDTTPPGITVSSPTDGAVVRVPRVDVVGAVDDTDAIVLVGRSAVTLAAGAFAVRDYPLAVGANAIPIEARDRLGNASSVEVRVSHLPPAPTASLTASPGQIGPGGSAQVQWSTTDATEVSITPGIGAVAPEGTLTVSPTASTTYTLLAVGPGGSVSAQAVVAVDQTPVCPWCPIGWYWPPTASLTAVPDPDGGGGATLQWSTTHATACWIDAGVGPVPCSGSLVVDPPSTTYYTLTASGLGGTVTARAAVGCRTPTAQLTADPSSVSPGEPFEFTWHATGVERCSITGVGDVACSGSTIWYSWYTGDYTLHGSGLCGEASSTTTVSVVWPPPAVQLAAAPETVLRGGEAMLTWSTRDAARCVLSGVGQVACSGSLAVRPQATTSYVLTASGLGGQGQAAATVTVTYPPPTATLSVFPASIAAGDATSLWWRTTDADSCSVAGVGTVACNGSLLLRPEQTTTYTLLANGPGGETLSTAVVTVVPRAPTATLSAAPATIRQGAATTLSWSSTDADDCSIAGIGGVGCQGALSVTPAASAVYTLRAAGPGGVAFASAAVTVIPTAPTVSMTAGPATITSGGSATLGWTSTGAATASIVPGIGDVPTSGSVVVSPTVSTIYMITVTGPGGSATAGAEVTVAPDPCPDADRDLSSVVGGDCGPVDCNDGDPATHPGAEEVAGDGIDQDCDGADLPVMLADADRDLFTPALGDCDDGNAAIFPGATDFPGNGSDEDCDGRDAVSPALADRDFDGFAAASGDCDDTNPDAHPEAGEIPCNGIDDDCDGADTCELTPLAGAESAFIHGLVAEARTGLPIAGASVMVARVGRIATDDDGSFAFPVPAEGVYVILVEKEGYTYAQRRVAVHSAERVSAGSIQLVPLDQGRATITPAFGGTLTSVRGNVELYAEPGAVAAAIDVSATRFEQPEELPGELPATSHFTMAVDLRPDGVTFRKPVRLRIGNNHNFAPATPIPVGYYRKDLASWVPDGMGRVTADGRWVEYWTTHFTPFDLNLPCIVPQDVAKGLDAISDQSDESNVPMLGCQAGNTANCRVTYHAGDLMEDVVLPPFNALGRSIATRLVYASDTANPKAVISSRAGLGGPGIRIPETMEMRVGIAGESVSTHFAAVAGDMRQAWLFDARDDAGNLLPTGAYPYGLTVTNWHQAVFASARSFGGPPVAPLQDASGQPIRAPWNRAATRAMSGRILVNNLADSPFGAGWNLEGVSRLHNAAGRGVVLVEGDGAKRYFVVSMIGTAAGNGTWGYSGDGGAATAAALAGPAGMCLDNRGNAYVADGNNFRIRRISPEGIITTFAGTGRRGYSGDGGPAVDAAIGYVTHLAVDAVGNLYFSDTDVNRVRKVSPSGVISTVAGSGDTLFNGDGVPALQAGVGYVAGLAVDAAGFLHFADTDNARVRRIDSRGLVTTVAGNGQRGFSGDGGPATAASLNAPTSLAVNGAGEIYVADHFNRRVRKIGADGVITTVAGNGVGTTAVDGDGGPATMASLGTPLSLAFTAEGSLLVGIAENRVRMVDGRGVISTVVGNGTPGSGPDGVPASESRIGAVGGLAVDGLDNWYVSDYSSIRKVSAGIQSASAVVFASPPGDRSVLTRFADGSATLREADGTVTHFDARGLQTRRVDANGNETGHTYDAEGRVAAIVHPSGQVVTFRYSGDHLASITDPAGRVTSFAHDAAGNLVAVTAPDGTTERFAYDANHMMVSKSTSCCTTQYVSDRHGFIASVVAPDGAVRSYAPSSARDLVNDLPPGVGTADRPAPAALAREDEYTDPAGNVTRMRTDQYGRLLEVTDPLGNVTSIRRDESGAPVRIVYPGGGSAGMSYDGDGNLAAAVDPLGASVSLTYEPVFSKIASVTDPLGNKTSMTYDDSGNLAAVTMPDGSTTSMTYDARGLPLSVATSLGTSTFAYDAAGNLASRTDPAGNTTNFSRDLAGNTTEVIDPEGKRAAFAYDARNRVTAITDALGQRTTFSYGDEFLAAVTDARGKTTHYEYGDGGYLATETDPLGFMMAIERYPGGAVKSVTDARGNAVASSYDKLGRLVGRGYPDGSAVRFEYDARGNLVAADNGFSGLSMSYDAAGRLVEVSSRQTAYQPESSVSYSYDAVGNRTASTDPAGGVTVYAYDSMGRLTSLSNPRGETTRYSYDAAGRLARRTLANGISQGFARDAAGFLQGLTIGGEASADPVLEYLYGRDGTGTILSLAGRSGSHDYAYDAAYRLVGAVHPEQPREFYSYDAVGNRTASSAAGDWSYDDGNRLQGYGGTSFTYDANGNMASRTDGGGTTTFSYDYENRLVRVDHPDGGYSAYAYDAFGRRIWTDENGIATSFVYDGDNVLMEYDADGLVRARYTFGPGVDEILSAEVPGRSGSVFYHVDHLGSVRRLTDAAGTVIAGYTYDSFGNVVEKAGSVYNPYGYAGRVLDERSGLMYYRARYYDPGLGRFITKDPIGFAGGDTNLYAYVGNNPVNQVDPSGLYGYEVHYGLTYQLAVRAGYTPEQSGILARANQRVDDSIFKSPYNPLGGTQQHFMSHDYALRGLDLARQQNNMELLGQFLHIMQDTYSHAGYEWYKGGHVPDGTKPDIFDRSSCRDKAMRDETLEHLIQFRNRIF